MISRPDIDLAEPMIGERVRVMRHFRHKTLQEVAGLAGITAGYLSMLERGLRPLDSRQLLYRLAESLECSVAELTGEPTPATSRDHAAALATVQDIRLALAETEGTPGDEPRRPVDSLTRDADEVLKLFMACEYGRCGELLGRLLSELSCFSPDDGEQTWRQVIAARTRASFTAWCLVTSLGYLDLGLRAAEIASRWSRDLDDPVFWGAAEFSRAQALYHIGATQPSLAVARRVADKIHHRHRDDPAAGQVYGTLHLHAAQTCAVLGDSDGASEHLREAVAAAAATGEHIDRIGPDGNVFELYFGPANVGLWQLAIAVEMREGGRAPEIVDGINQRALASPNRKAYMYADLGRGLAQDRRRDREAIDALCEAERIAPQLVRTTPLVRETVTDLLRRARRRAGGRNLTGLAYRMGIIHRPVGDI